MNKSELIKVYEEKKSILEQELEKSECVKHKDSYKKCANTLEILSLIIEDIKNLNGETVKREHLIDFVKWAGKNSPSCTALPFSKLVDNYLKSLK